MANVNTTIKIQADDGGSLKRVGKAIVDAFKPATVSGFGKETVKVTKSLKDLLTKQVELTKEMGKVEKWTKEYKKFGVQIKAAANEARALEKALKQIDSFNKRDKRQEKEEAADKGPSKKRGFTAGFAQGIGLADYIPDDKNMAARMGGQLVGGGIRRAGSAISSPFTSPGMSGLQQAAQGIPIVGGFASMALGSAASSYGSAVSYDQSRRSNLYFDNTGESTEEDMSKPRRKLRKGEKAKPLSSDLTSGLPYGFGPQEVQGRLGQFFGARGGERSSANSESQFRTAMAAESRYGISMEQSGAFSRGSQAGGGGKGANNLERVLSSAFVSGLRGAQIGEYLSKLVELQQTAEQQGVKIDAESFTRTTLGLNQAGIKGGQAGRIAGQLTTAAQGTSSRGAQSPMDVMMLRAAGFDPSQGAEGYFGAREKLEAPDSATMNNIIKMAAEGAGGTGGPKAKSGFLRQALGSIGVNLSTKQAGDLLQGYGEGKTPDISSLLKQVEGRDGAMESEAQSRVKSKASRTITAGGLEAERIGVGQQSGFVAQFESAGIKAGQVMANFAGELNGLAGVVNSAMKSMSNVTKGGVGGTLSTVGSFLGIGTP